MRTLIVKSPDVSIGGQSYEPSIIVIYKSPLVIAKTLLWVWLYLESLITILEGLLDWRLQYLQAEVYTVPTIALFNPNSQFWLKFAYNFITTAATTTAWGQ